MEPSRETDDALLRACRRGDRSAFEALYARYEDWALALAWRFCGHREDALDVLQETFTYLFRKLPGLELRCRLKTFLYPAIKHLALARRQASRRRTALESEPEAAALRSAAGVDDLLALLPEAQQEVVWLRFVDGMDLASIAETLEIPLGTVKSRLHAALETLRAPRGAGL